VRLYYLQSNSSTTTKARLSGDGACVYRHHRHCFSTRPSSHYKEAVAMVVIIFAACWQ